MFLDSGENPWHLERTNEEVELMRDVCVAVKTLHKPLTHSS